MSRPRRPRPEAGAARTALAVAYVLLLAACGGGEPPARPGPEEQSAATEGEPREAASEEEAPAPATPLRSSNVEIYFPSQETTGLVGEWREIFNTVTPGDRAKQIVADLISGPSGPGAGRAVPPGTRLRQAFVLDNGVAYLDFSAELAEGLGGGSASELLTVYSIIDSVVANVPEIHRVGILINGRTVETLNGHMDLRQPLPPDFSLIAVSNTVRDAGPSGSDRRLATSRERSRPDPS